ncbi:putative reverse transcriptase domain-containing protein [Tanacetum coccineum]
MGIGGIAKVAIGGIRCGVCRQSGEERGTMLGVNLAGSEDRHPFGVGDDEQLFSGYFEVWIMSGKVPESYTLYCKYSPLVCTAYHPQMDGQSECAIQTLEGMLRACVIVYGGRWGIHLPLAELSYNNRYHLSIQYALFEALYGRKYKVILIKENLKAARDRQKSYVDCGRKPLEFKVGDRVLLKVMPWKGVVHFGKKGKLASRYVRPFEILERIGLVAYRLRLPEELNSVRDTFHVSNLKKCLADANLHVPLNEIKIDKTLRFVEEPVEIMDREVKSLKRRRIPLVKVCWNSKRGPEFTWEHKDYMKSKYPQLFVDRAVELTS